MFSSTKSFILKAFFIALFLSVPSSGNAADTGYLDRSERVNGWNTRSVFEPLYEKHRDSVVEILEDGHQIALGTVVSEDGYIVTKASEFGMALEVRDAKNKVYVPEFISVDRDNDLALLKIKADGMQAVQWSGDATPSMGQWMISPHEDETQVRVGVVSAIQRAIPKKPGALGVQLMNAADFLSLNSFKDFNEFRILVEQKKRPLDQFLAEFMSPDDLDPGQAAEENQDSPEERILDLLNRTMFRRSLFNGELLEGVQLSEPTERLMAKEASLEGGDRFQYRSVLNLMVLEDAFPELIIPRLKGGLITGVRPDSGAEKAGVLPEDVVVSVNGISVMTSSDIIQIVRQHGPGEKLNLKIHRGEQELVKTVTLGYFDTAFPEQDVNIELSGDISERRTGYQEVIQHEIPIPPKAMGGPLMDLEGKVVGVNIARYNRVTTFALPAALVRASIEKLK
jgi:S1-C subfamily serine protease